MREEPIVSANVKNIAIFLTLAIIFNAIFLTLALTIGSFFALSLGYLRASRALAQDY